MSLVPRLSVRVADVTAVAPDVRRFEFEAEDGAALPHFSPGAHVLVDMQDNGVARRNAYTLTSSPRAPFRYAISVRRDASGRGGSRYLHDKVGRGDRLVLSHPRNAFPLDLRARKHLLIAGGIGITPFLSMADQLFHDCRSFELHYASRSRAHAAYADELPERYGARVRLYASDQGERIPLPDLLSRQPLGCHLYVCGPERMIAWARDAAREAGWPAQSVHSERFLAPPVGAPFPVRLARSGITLSVRPQESVLEAIERAGVEVRFLCRGGACGQCETEVLSCEGRLLHHDHWLSEEDKASGRRVMPCVSRFEGRLLTLDL